MNLKDYIIWRNARDLGYYGRANPNNRMFYGLGLGGECGEVQNIIKKHIRDHIPDDITRAKLVDELGDTFWYYVGVMNCFGIELEEVLEYNRDKLVARNGTKSS